MKIYCHKITAGTFKIEKTNLVSETEGALCGIPVGDHNGIRYRINVWKGEEGKGLRILNQDSTSYTIEIPEWILNKKISNRSLDRIITIF